MDRADPFGDPDSIAHSLDFSYGHRFRAKVRDLFSTTINSILASGHFFLVVSFGRAQFRLDILNAFVALSSCLGCTYDEIYVVKLSDRVFKFSVASKNIGFMVHNLRSFACPQFVCYFHLWGRGGPNWQKEELLWYTEEDANWSTISRSKSHVPHARSSCSHHFRPIPVNQSFQRIHKALDRPSIHSVLTGANLIPLGTRQNTSTEPSSSVSNPNRLDPISSGGTPGNSNRLTWVRK
jgi:hypothetical protein